MNTEKILETLNTPFYNSLIGGIMLYLIIIISNKGNPLLASVLSSFPIGLVALLTVNTKTAPKFINSNIFVNVIPILMWIVADYLIIKKTKMTTIGYTAIAWLLFCLIYYVFRMY